MNITFDKDTAELILEVFGSGTKHCEACGLEIKPENLGVIAKKDNEFSFWHNNFICMLDYIDFDNRKGKNE